MSCVEESRIVASDASAAPPGSRRCAFLNLFSVADKRGFLLAQDGDVDPHGCSPLTVFRTGRIILHSLIFYKVRFPHGGPLLCAFSAWYSCHNVLGLTPSCPDAQQPEHQRCDHDQRTTSAARKISALGRKETVPSLLETVGAFLSTQAPIWGPMIPGIIT